MKLFFFLTYNVFFVLIGVEFC